MGQPKITTSGNLVIAKFGNAALPNGQGTLANIDLNDTVNTVLTDFQSDDANRQIGLEQLLYRGRGVYESDDFGGRSIVLPMTYKEDTTHFLGQFFAALAMAGEQQLTFDNATYILCKYAGASSRKLRTHYPPFWWDFNLELIAASPWFQDAAATTGGPTTITVDSGQTINITYAGSVWAEPVFTYHVPATNAVAINSIRLTNTMSGEALTVNFLTGAHGAIPASTLADVLIDCAAMTAIQTQNGDAYDVSGSFPMLYPPVSTVNPIQIITTPASGSTSGCTLASSYVARWQI